MLGDLLTPKPSHGPRANGHDDFIPTYQLLAIASSGMDVVQSVGGLVADLSLSGWHVDVLLSAQDEQDDRRIRTIGARTRDFATGIESLSDGGRSRVIAVASEAFRTDERIKRAVRNSLRRSPNNLIVWGGVPTANLFGRTAAAHYRPSAAAQAFKAIAMADAPAPDTRVHLAESLYLSGTSRRLPLDLDLVSAS